MKEKFEIESAKVGEIVVFGNLEWIVLKKENDRALVLSKKCVSELPYEEKTGCAVWEISTIRHWLNRDFYSLFNDEEKMQIANTKINNLDVPSFSSHAEGGWNTIDKVFLLSYDEVEDLYFNKEYLMNDEEEFWWLRTPGLDNYKAICVQSAESLYKVGYEIEKANGIRPAMNILFSNSKEYLEEVRRNEKDGTEAIKEFSELVKSKNEGENIFFADHEWTILEKYEDKVLVFSTKGVRNDIFSQDRNAQWRDSTIRTWLNVDFYDSLLLWEKQLVISSFIENKKSGKHIITNQKNTVDKFFLLSTHEMEKYSHYIVPLNEFFDGLYEADNFWLRTMGKDYHKVAYVDGNNTIDYDGEEVGNYYTYPFKVRPAVYLKLY